MLTFFFYFLEVGFGGVRSVEDARLGFFHAGDGGSLLRLCLSGLRGIVLRAGHAARYLPRQIEEDDIQKGYDK